MPPREQALEITRLAEEAGIEPAVLLALVEVESGGRVFVRIGKRLEPLIRFEGHYFDRRLSGSALERARREGLADPRAGAIRNPASQPQRWRMLQRAAAIDARAAYESTSWGVGQVMGAHWAWLGYASVDALAAAARSGLSGQIGLMLRYVDRSGLRAALKGHDWKAVARGYNGPGFARNAYDRKLEAAWRRHAGLEGARHRQLRFGMRGDDVAALQQSLASLGHPLAADGIFGNATHKALASFQRKVGLAPDGIFGPKTRAAIHARKDQGSAGWLSTVATWLRRLSGAAQ